MAREQVEYKVGECLPGTKYRVVRKLGQGGMGVVLEVVKEPKIRGVLKVIHPVLAADRGFRTRFFDEVRILAELDHPNIVRVTDYDELADGTPYFAMELLRGSTVRQTVRRVGRIQPVLLHKIMCGLLDGLEYVHSHKPPIVHRDIKGENIFIHLPAYGEASIKLIDFGVAGGYDIVEKKGFFVGTPRYAAPEQLRGEPSTPLVDIYAAAIVLYEALAGRGPFDDTELIAEDRDDRQRALIRAHLTIPAPSIRSFVPDIPEMIEELLRAALSKDPKKRPESAAAFASKLYPLQFLSDAPINVNTTAPTLMTMVTLTSEADDPPSTPTPDARDARKRDPMKDTAVDTELPFGMRGSNRGDETAATPVGWVEPAPIGAASTDPTPVASPEPARLRSFAASEAAKKERGELSDYDGLEALPRRPRHPTIRSDAGTSQSVGMQMRLGSRRSSLLAFGVGLPALVVLMLAVVHFVGRAASPAQASESMSVVPPLASVRLMAPLPPEQTAVPADPSDPTPADSSLPARAALPPAPVASAEPALAPTPPRKAPPAPRPDPKARDIDPGSSPFDESAGKR